MFKYTEKINELYHNDPFTYYLESTSVINILLYLFYPYLYICPFPVSIHQSILFLD